MLIHPGTLASGTTTWNYDTLDRQTVMTFHDGSTRTNRLDLASDLIGYVDENGSVFANTFDVLGRKTAVTITPAAIMFPITREVVVHKPIFAGDWVGVICGLASILLD